MQMVRSEGRAIRCLVIHSLPAWRGKPRLVACIFLFLLRCSSNRAVPWQPAKLPYLAPVGPRYLPPTQPRSVSPLPRAPESVIGRLGSCADAPDPADAMRRSKSSTRRRTGR